ncbi:MAG: lysophospholipid acyltransferase family protein [Gammaproteobacteria bacterium]|jgi:1-acyl-sn-glycerol-3-phosphate acyltransferase|nr:lysophospholipid acyltransferase family protein [Gammaproteobacteria bacterium]
MVTWRSTVFYVGVFPATVLVCVIGILILPLDRRTRYLIVTRWSKFALWWLRISCGLTSRVAGVENIPDEPGVIFCKHQSAWETMALQFIFPPHVQVVKRELLFVPFFGWGLASLNPIAIDRAAGAKALRRVLRIGADRIAQGWWVLLFPEGTRTSPGDQPEYSPSAAALAIRARCKLVPVAHNAGVFWSRNGLEKFHGEIQIAIGPAIDSEGKSAAEMTMEAKAWVEAQCAKMPKTRP